MTTVTVREVMTREVVALAPETSLDTAARVLAARRISGAPVITALGRIVGVISLVDLCDPDRPTSDAEGFSTYYRVVGGTAQELSDGAPGLQGRVEDLMTRGAVTADVTTSLTEASDMMLAHKVHRLIISDNGVLVGIVSTLDVLRGMKSNAAAG